MYAHEEARNLSASPISNVELRSAGTLPVKERIFRASFLNQLTQGAWPLAIAAILPAATTVIALVWKYFGNEKDEALTKSLVVFVIAGVGPLIAFLAKGLQPDTGGTSTCSWIALGNGYIRLGMSFLRSRIAFGQIVEVERGNLRGRKWHPAMVTSQAALEFNGAGRMLRTAAPITGGTRVRIRLVLKGTWEATAVAYPIAIDPFGELTVKLQYAASLTRQRTGLRVGSADEEISARFRELERKYRNRLGRRLAEKATDIVLTADLSRLGAPL
ncbi:MAG: hypothetical protein ACUVX8_18020 [Candidatus Zipacnadales bacterium]